MKFDILHIAEYGTLDEMKEAIKEGSDINIKDKDEGGTSLMGAIAYANTDIALFLIENGADAGIKSHKKTFPLSSCSAKCLKAQMDNYRDEACGKDKNPDLRYGQIVVPDDVRER